MGTGSCVRAAASSGPACGRGSCRNVCGVERPLRGSSYYPGWMGIGVTDVSPGHGVPTHASKWGVITVRGLPAIPYPTMEEVAGFVSAWPRLDGGRAT